MAPRIPSRAEMMAPAVQALRDLADVEETIATEIVAERKRLTFNEGKRVPGHYTEAARMSKMRAEALRRLADQMEKIDAAG